MKSMINKIYQTNKGGFLSEQECLQINAELAILKVEEIPFDQRQNVIDYLIADLNHNSDESRFTSTLDNLLQELQKIKNVSN